LGDKLDQSIHADKGRMIPAEALPKKQEVDDR
jgi:hypothetical protein